MVDRKSISLTQTLTPTLSSGLNPNPNPGGGGGGAGWVMLVRLHQIMSRSLARTKSVYDDDDDCGVIACNR